MALARLFASSKARLAALALAGGLAIGAPLSNSTMPQSLQLVGYSGLLAEWTIAAALTRTESGRELRGPLSLQHTGLCSVDGPEKKTGQLRLRLARFSSRIDATLTIDNAECNYSGSLSDVYTGLMFCPGQEPAPLTLWIK
jgi:hypothetical protein